MIKFLSITISTCLLAVVFLYYLITNQNFIPFDSVGNIDWINAITFLILAFIIVLSICVLVIFGIRRIFIKPNDLKGNIVLAFRQGILITIGLLIVFLLHIFHIVNFIWGLSILLVVIVSIFVI